MMKKLFSNPIFALILTVIVVIASTLMNTHVKLGRRCDDVTEQFYQGGDAPIAASLRSFATASERVALLAGQNGIESSDVVADVDTLRTQLAKRKAGAAAMAEVYSRLLSEVFSLESQLARMELSEEDAETLRNAQHEAAEAKAAVDTSPYNSVVRVFLSRYDRFPATLLAGLSGVKMPQLFA